MALFQFALGEDDDANGGDEDEDADDLEWQVVVREKQSGRLVDVMPFAGER